MTSERVQRAVDLLLDDALLATQTGDWETVRERARMAMSLDPTNQEAQRFVELASHAEREIVPSPPESEGSPQSASERARNAAKSITELVPFSSVATRVIEAVNDESVSTAELARVIGIEPALTAKVLRVANSAYYRRFTRVSSIQEALTLLGSREIEALAVTACVTTSLPPGHIVSYRDFWRFSVSVATLANVLERASGSRPLEAFTAGILHNIGLLALDLYSPEGLRRALDLQLPGLRRLHDRERHVFGFTDSQLGAEVARRWLLPERFVEVIEHHGARTDEAASHGELTDWIVRARVYVRSLGVSDGVEQTPGEPAAEWLRPPLSETIQRLGGVEQILSRADKFVSAAT